LEILAVFAIQTINCARARVLHFSVLWLIELFSENGINLTSSHEKENYLITTTSSLSIDNLNNNDLNNLNSYAKSTTITSNASPNQSPSPNGLRRQSPTSFEHQLRIFIPNYDNLFDNNRGQQQPHSSRAGGSGMSDRRNMMGDRRMNSSMMDRQMVSKRRKFSWSFTIFPFLLSSLTEPLRFIIVAPQRHDGQSIIRRTPTQPRTDQSPLKQLPRRRKSIEWIEYQVGQSFEEEAQTAEDESVAADNLGEQ
jgi:hypothetical protein